MTSLGVPYADAVRWTRDALDGLVHAHSLGVLHRDVKPSNLLVGPTGEALLSDFGLAEDTVRSRIVSAAVYLAHAAPELYAYAPSSEQTDVWAAGATLYRFVTGSYPFEAGDLVPILKGDYKAPQAINPQVTRCLTTIIRKALEPDPARRYQVRARDALRPYRLPRRGLLASNRRS
jgi:serine/threonine protein kinase